MFEILCVLYNLSVFLIVAVKRFLLLVTGVVCCSCVKWFPTADIVLEFVDVQLLPVPVRRKALNSRPELYEKLFDEEPKACFSITDFLKKLSLAKDEYIEQSCNMFVDAWPSKAAFFDQLMI